MSHHRNGVRIRGIWVAAAGVLVAALAGCADGVTNPGGGTPSRPSFVDGFQLETVEVTTCQYGGEYPNCKPKPPESGGTIPSTSPATGGSTGGGGGGTGDNTPPPDSTQATCDPRDPGCEQPLTTVDKEVLGVVLNRYRRPAENFTDPTARDICAAMADKFTEKFAAGQVFRGATDTPPGDPTMSVHRGAYDTQTGHIHFDPGYLDKAAAGDPYWERDLANDALHEAAHALGYDHGESMNSPWGPIYMESPFDLLSPGSNSCLNWN